MTTPPELPRAAWRSSRPKDKGPDLFVTLRGGKALVRGRVADDIRMLVCPDALWSRGGRGWVVTAGQAEDVLAYCQSLRLLVIVTDEEARP